MTVYVKGKAIIITGAGGGFGKLVALKTAAMGARVACADINQEAAEATVSEIAEAGGEALAVKTDVRSIEETRSLAALVIDSFGKIDVLINNAGIMPLAFLSDHEAALDAWNNCIDINFKGVMNGCAAVYDQMIAQGSGQIVNISSIYGNHPVAGASVYGATKAAIDYYSESVRVESLGKIKVTTIKPTGVPVTGLSASVVNPAAAIGITGQNAGGFMELVEELRAGKFPAEKHDAERITYASLAPDHVAEAIIHSINQPLGVSYSSLTVRASGDHFVV